MSRKTILLIILLTVITTGLLILAIASQKEEIEQLSTTSPTVSPTPNEAILSLSQSNQTTKTDGTKQVDLWIDTGKNKVTAIQMELAYDPNVLSDIKVVPAFFIENPVILFNQVDTKNGRVSFAVGISSPDKTLSGKGIIATINYRVLPSAKADNTTLHFLSKTGVSAEGIKGTVLKETNDLNLLLK